MITDADRSTLIWAEVTLNGEPARIVGRKHRFATVVQSTTGLSAQWSWEAAKRIVQRGGEFQS